MLVETIDRQAFQIGSVLQCTVPLQMTINDHTKVFHSILQIPYMFPLCWEMIGI